MSTYQYKPLPSSDTYIRLIELPTGENAGMVSCKITQHLITQSLVYETVSYSWGSKEDTSETQVFDGDEDATAGSSATATLLTIPTNLNKFLLRSRANRKGIKRTFWVKLMRDIYQGAKLTVVWLGPEGDDSARGIAFAKTLYVRAVGQASGANGVVARILRYFPGFAAINAIFGRDWKAFFTLFERPWFERAWFVQEVSMAPRVSIISLLLSQNEIQQGLRRSHYEILARHRQAHASDPRDHIFSFYGLACHASFKELGIEPRYDLPVEEVCINIARATLQKTTNFDCLCIPRAPAGGGGLRLPSWAPDWSRAEPSCNTLLQLEVGNLDTLPKYQATSGSTYTPPVIDPLRLTLELSGYVVDTVSTLSSTWTSQSSTGRQTLWQQAAVLRGNQRLVHDWFAALGFWERAHEPYPQATKLDGDPAPNDPAPCVGTTGIETRDEAIWQTLVAGPSSISVPPSVARAAWNGFLQRQRLLRWLPCYGMGESMAAHMAVVALGQMLHFLGLSNPEMAFRALTGPMLGRRAMCTAGGLIGLAPAGAAVGDRIVLLQGGRVPFVLRPHGEEWELIGDCYVHGIMAGEAWGRRIPEPFVIV